MSESKGIQWSAPVLIRSESKGLAVSLPTQVVNRLGATVGDVLNFTQLPDGSIEVWVVKKSHYTSLDDMKVPAKKAPSRPAAGAKKPRKAQR